MIVYVLSTIIAVLVILLAVILLSSHTNGISNDSLLGSFVQDVKKSVARERRTEYYEDGRAVKFLYECVGNDKDGKEVLYYPSGTTAAVFLEMCISEEIIRMVLW